MARGPLKPKTVAVKVPEELAEFLDRLPNKSEFIRDAILAQLQMTCPLCDGSGVVPTGLCAHYRPVLLRHRSGECVKCGEAEEIPPDPTVVADEERSRWEQFFHGGPFYCPRCYAAAQECGECGWRLSGEQLAEHAHPSEPD
jgi:hypothetical protein